MYKHKNCITFKSLATASKFEGQGCFFFASSTAQGTSGNMVVNEKGLSAAKNTVVGKHSILSRRRG